MEVAVLQLPVTNCQGLRVLTSRKCLKCWQKEGEVRMRRSGGLDSACVGGAEKRVRDEVIPSPKALFQSPPVCLCHQHPSSDAQAQSFSCFFLLFFLVYRLHPYPTHTHTHTHARTHAHTHTLLMDDTSRST